MPLVRSPLQSDDTFEEFYQRDSWSGLRKEVSSKMLEFISEINQLFPETRLIASTSHQRLCLHEAGEEELKWILIIDYSLIHIYHISYKMPDEQSPWKEGWISGECSSLEKAIEYFLIAMKNTGFWKKNRELEVALNRIKTNPQN